MEVKKALKKLIENKSRVKEARHEENKKQKWKKILLFTTRKKKERGECGGLGRLRDDSFSSGGGLEELMTTCFKFFEVFAQLEVLEKSLLLAVCFFRSIPILDSHVWTQWRLDRAESSMESSRMYQFDEGISISFSNRLSVDRYESF